MTMKNVVMLLLVVALVFSFSTVALAAEPQSVTDTESVSVPDTVSTRIVHSYTKTVTKTYPSFSSIPESINYKEYNSELSAWFSGVLYLQSAVNCGSYWNATYTGTIVGNI